MSKYNFVILYCFSRCGNNLDFCAPSKWRGDFPLRMWWR